MAQLDRLLTHVAAKGGALLRMLPNQPPTMETASGSELPILSSPVPPTMLEVLVREILPSSQAEGWLATGEATFDYIAGSDRFRVALARQAQGIVLEAAPQNAREAVPTSVQAPPALAPNPLPVPIPVPLPEVSPQTAAPSPLLEGAPGAHPLAHRLFQALLDHKGSDLHCSAFETPIARIHGDMEELLDFGILGQSQLLEMMEAVATPAAWQQFQEKRDADFAYAYEPGNCRLRVNYFVDRVGPGFVCRVIPNQIPDPDQLGLPEPVRRLADLSKGLVLVTGPTGSGKSTTLAAILDIANQTRNDHIITIEDPIEFVHPRKRCLVNQREVGTHTDSFKSGLRAALREDPDIVLVGEMRDLETISIALETAITGHLVFGTLHTNSAIGTIDRIVDQFPPDRQQQVRVMLADSLKACLSQILIKRTGGGRIAALESLFITPAIANLIREGKNFQIPSSMQTGRAYGQKLMNDALIDLIKAGQVDPMEAYMKCPDKESFIQVCKRSNIPCDPRGMDIPSQA